ncbi:MAG: RepB family plasmid replication initiator protein [Candidatus Hadarchaeum sp.]
MNPFAVLSALLAELQKYMSENHDPSQPENLQLKTETKKKAGSLIVRSELNLEQNSVFTVSTYRKKSREIVVRETAPTGEITERRAIIGKTAGGVETGVLTTHHFKVYLALLELWEQAGRPLTEPVHFTILKIIKRLELVDSGKNYQDIKRLLRDLRQIPITFQNSFYIPQEAKHTDLSDITILNHLRIYERKSKGAQKTYGYGEFQFDRYILENLINNHSHPLRLDIVKGFKKHKDTAILLYTYLDRCLAFKDRYEITLEKLFEHLDLSQRHVKYPSGRKKVIEPVLKELEGKPLSTGVLSYCRIHKTQDNKDYKLVAHKKQFEGLPSGEEKTLELPWTVPTRQRQPDDLIAKLTAQGLTESQAQELLTAFGREVIQLQLEALPYRLERYRRRREQANTPAILYQSIKHNWTPPKSYFLAQEEQERQRRAAQRREAQRKQEQEQKRQQQAEAAKARQHREELLARYRTLSPKAQKEIDQLAFANLSPFTKAHAHKLKAEGKDPLESPLIRSDFEQQRLKILEQLKAPEGS